jgi:hypothetical protein
MLIATPMGDDPRSFDELMARMGVEKLGGKTAKKQAAAHELPKEKPKPRPKVVAKPTPPPPVQEDLRGKELEAARATIEALRAELEEARRPPPVDPSSLAVLLETRGIRGADEARGLLEALAQARLTDALLGELVVRRPDRIAPFLRDKVLLSCGRPECPTIPGLAVLVVPVERCDACGGADVDRARRRFQDACLVHGILVVGVVGGSVRDQRLLERASTHHRLALRVFGSAADARAGGAQLVIAWNVPVEVGPRAIATQARNAVALMDEVAESLLT